MFFCGKEKLIKEKAEESLGKLSSDLFAGGMCDLRQRAGLGFPSTGRITSGRQDCNPGRRRRWRDAIGCGDVFFPTGAVYLFLIFPDSNRLQ